MISITQRRPPRTVLAEALQKLDSLSHSRCRVGLSPHAPYSAVPELLRLSAQAARRRRWLLASHLAESAAEFQMFKKGGGEMFDWLKRSGREMSDSGGRSPVQHAELCGLLGKNLLATHVNHLARKDAALLAKRQVSIVHCPRSHAYFRHTPFPITTLRRAGVNVCLGTDSLATVCRARGQRLELDMFEEMRALARAHPAISPRSIVEMATVNGARALGLARRIGHLSAGAFADVIAVPVGSHGSRIYERLVEQGGSVRASLIEGQWAIPP
jgi:cytosine/adenosine deaminase-related metal-dependent hydrolase